MDSAPSGHQAQVASLLGTHCSLPHHHHKQTHTLLLGLELSYL